MKTLISVAIAATLATASASFAQTQPSDLVLPEQQKNQAVGLGTSSAAGILVPALAAAVILSVALNDDETDD